MDRVDVHSWSQGPLADRVIICGYVTGTEVVVFPPHVDGVVLIDEENIFSYARETISFCRRANYGKTF